MGAPKDPEKRKIWIENLSKTHIGINIGEKHYLYGKHLSQETKDKLSIANSGEKHYLYGKHHSQKTKDKLSKSKLGQKNPMFGKPNPALAERMKGLMGEKHPMFGKGEKFIGEKNPMFGKHHSMESKIKMSEIKLGKDNPNYINGKSNEPYTVEFNNELKELIRHRDGYKCQKCNCPEIENGVKLTCHHVDYDKKNCLPENLITLCVRCNVKVNTNRKKWTRYFQKKLAIGNKQKQLCLVRL